MRMLGALLAACGLLTAVEGCGGGPKPPAIAPASGVVTYNGIPVKDAYVKFTQTGSPVVAGGMTDETGRFTLTTYQKGDGGPVGVSKVTVQAAPVASAEISVNEQKWAEAEAITDQAEKRRAKDELIAQGRAAIEARPLPKARGDIPKKFESVETTTLSGTIEAGQQNQFEFDLAK